MITPIKYDFADIIDYCLKKRCDVSILVKVDKNIRRNIHDSTYEQTHRFCHNFKDGYIIRPLRGFLK